MQLTNDPTYTSIHTIYGIKMNNKEKLNLLFNLNAAELV